MDWTRIQKEQREWAERNFGPRNVQDPLMGLIEETGELAHALLKRRQNIRGEEAEHIAAARDAVGDVTIYLLDYCTARDLAVGPVVDAAYARNPYRERALRGDGRMTEFDALCHLSYAIGVEAERSMRHGATLYETDGMGLPGIHTEDERRTTDVANIFGGLMDVCCVLGWNFEQVVLETWLEVQKRDWRRDPSKGVSADA